MKKEIIWELCPKCKRRNKHEIIEAVTRETVDHENNEFDVISESYGNSYRETSIFQIIECRGCGTISYKQFKISTTNDGGPIKSDEKLYPMRDITSIDFKDFGPKIPEKIKVLYREVILSFNNKLGVLCAAGIRAIIEGICNEKNIEGGNINRKDKGTGLPKTDPEGNLKLEYSKNLDGKIEGLSEKGYITKNYASTLHDLRFLGNKAVHQLDKPNDEFLKLAIDIVEHTLSSIYEIEIKAQKLAQKDLMIEETEEN